MITLITYTHSKCKDACRIYLDLLKKHYPYKHIITSNEFTTEFEHCNFCRYKDTDPYYINWKEVLDNYDEEFFIYMQEDFFLYNEVDINKLKSYLEILKKHPEVSFIKLIKSGIKSNIKTDIDTLFVVDPNVDYPFSMQPTIWKTKQFSKIIDTELLKIPWDEPKITSNIINSLGIRGYYHYDGEKKRGYDHYDSNIFPYIATALIKGKWNTKEYPELIDILEKYNVDKSLRGEYYG